MPVQPYGLERHRPTGWGVAAGGDKRIVLSLPAEECGGGGEASERLCLLIGFGCCVGDRRVEWRPAVRAFPVRLGRMSLPSDLRCSCRTLNRRRKINSSLAVESTGNFAANGEMFQNSYY